MTNRKLIRPDTSDFKKDGQARSVRRKQAPPEQTMVETDSPYLTPEPKRAEPNEPANVVLTGAALAEVWGVGATVVAVTTSATASRVFGAPGG